MTDIRKMLFCPKESTPTEEEMAMNKFNKSKLTFPEPENIENYPMEMHDFLIKNKFSHSESCIIVAEHFKALEKIKKVY